MKHSLRPIALLLAALPALAEEPTRQLETVQVEMVKDPAAMPYGRMNGILQDLKKHGQGLVTLDFKLTRKDGQPTDKVKIALVQDEAYTPIPRDAAGRFELPVLPPEQAKTAELASTLPRGQAQLHGRIKLTLKPEQLTMAQVRRIMEVGRTVRGELLPWYARWLFPQVGGVRICSEQPRWELEWRDERGQLLGLPLPTEPGGRDPDAPKDSKRACTVLTGEEPWPASARLLAPADATLSVRMGTKDRGAL
ncbi:hypothetical protein G8A07_08420 [Roseateles sp. DAIF2]|uniref:hypothetical protein n=1 Tax=Roseateles sp. DAIF2 TaxID=2714952 RepID=UPI0018A2E1D0|nr:hypothetical protein [Roseateles sp. DAIF2]QPF72950.1 hypothetical protein G8A07_08420 [Roseateles sp. DAIF2]